MLLAIDTSTRYGGVALWSQGKAIISLCWHSTRNHTEELMPGIETLLNKSGLKVKDLDKIGVALGPGGFSALRVGLSAAKGLAMPLGLPIAGIRTLEMEAYPFASTDFQIYSLLNIGRGEIATASYRGDNANWVKVTEEQICQPEELLCSITEPALLCGEGVTSYQEILRAGLPVGSILMPFISPTSRLLALAMLSESKLGTDQAEPIASLQPFYLRRPNIGPPKVMQRIKT